MTDIPDQFTMPAQDDYTVTFVSYAGFGELVLALLHQCGKERFKKFYVNRPAAVADIARHVERIEREHYEQKSSIRENERGDA